MAVEGTLETSRLTEILQVVSHQRKTGILTVQGESNIIAVSFLRGQVVAADALNRTVEEGLGEVLVRQGLLTADQFEEVTARHQGGSGRLIDLLVDRQKVSREDLLGALRLQTQELLLELLGWEHGEFKFYSGDEVSYEEGFEPIPVEELLVRWLESRGEIPRDPGVPAVYRRVESPRQEIRERIGEPRPGEELSGVLWLSPEESDVWAHLGEGETVASLALATGLDPYKVRFSLYRLLRGGAVETLSAAEAAAVPPPTALERLELTPTPTATPTWAPTPRPRLVRTPAAAPAPATPAPAREAPPAVAAAELAPLPRAGRRVESLVAGGMGVALVLALGWALLVAPEGLLLPFPWLARERAAQVALQVDGTCLKVDRAAKTFFLLEGRFPENLSRLSALGLLGRADTSGPDGAPLAYTADEESYSLRVAGADLDEGAGAGATEAITGDFLLDPDFLAPPASSQKPPLVLLD